MKINIKPVAYLVGGRYFSETDEQAKALARGFREEAGIEPLHPESLVIDLAEALQVILDSVETEIDVNVDAYFKGRGLLDRIKNGSSS